MKGAGRDAGLDSRVPPGHLLVWAIGVELLLLAAMLGVPPVAGLLGQRFPPLVGVGIAATAVPAVLLADAAQKLLPSVVRPGSLPTRSRGGDG